MIYDIYAVGNTLRSIRNKYGYTQNDMAESLDVSYIHYSQIEQGRHRMSLELMLKIVTKYGVDTTMFLPEQLVTINEEQIIQTAGVIVSTDAIKKVDAMLVRQLQIGEYDG